MIDDFAKQYLHSDLREIRKVMLWKLDGLGEYDIRRPLTSTGTNLLRLVKHLSLWESRYFGEVFDRPFPEPLRRWDDAEKRGTQMWATEHETRQDIIDRYLRMWDHADATITALAIDSPGYVPWWPRPNVKLFNILVHMPAAHALSAMLGLYPISSSSEGKPGSPPRRRGSTCPPNCEVGQPPHTPRGCVVVPDEPNTNVATCRRDLT